MNYVENLFSLTGKTAVVIGGGGVLGGAMAEGLARAGCDIAIIDPQCDKAKKRIDSLKDYGVNVLPIEMDATRIRELKRASLQIQRNFGKVDILINAPGINSATPFFEISEEEWGKILEINLKSMFLACQVVGKMMIEEKQGGSIINISSVSSGPPLSRVFTYSISKAGVNSLTQFLAREWAPHRIRVNALAPGFFPAEQNRKILSKDRIESIFKHTPMNRFGEPEELVGGVLWLASEKASSFVTGAIIRIDGGYTAMTI
jgi:NAD(P)-dependent dehydrogenase (short-subunit alcohol dehydrogenase family)